MNDSLAQMIKVVAAGSVATALLVPGCADLEQAEEATDGASVTDSGAEAARPVSTDTALEVEYDRFENHTSIATPLIEGEPYHVEASYDCSGPPGCRPEDATIILIPNETTRDSLRARATAGEQLDDPSLDVLAEVPDGAPLPPVSGSLIFLADGEKRYKVDDRAWDAWRERRDATDGPGLGRGLDPGSTDEEEWVDLPSWGLTETGIGAVTARVPFEAFRSIALADHVEFRLNGYEAALTARQLVVLRRMAALVDDAP